MELRIINTFLHIAELRSFSRAARELGYSQSAVSAQIAQLEAELETPLFDRVGKTVRLTDAGQTFLSYARTLLATSEQAKAAITGSVVCAAIMPGRWAAPCAAHWRTPCAAPSCPTFYSDTTRFVRRWSWCSTRPRRTR